MDSFTSLIDLLGLMQANLTDSISQWFFFQEVFTFLDGEIDTFRRNVVGNLLEMVAAISLIVLTIWIFFQGFLIVSGRSRESMMGLVVSSLRATLIVFAASTMAFGATTIYTFISDTMPKGINEMVTGEYEQPARNIDNAMTAMQGAMVLIDSIPVLDNSSNKTDKDRAVMLTGLGAAGPSVVGGAMMLMYKVAIAMFVAFGPIFILALLFDFSKSLFSKWLFYGIGTMFAMAVLNFMVTVAMKMVLAVTAAFAAQAALSMAINGGGQPISSMALQQGGLGMILTILLVSIPPMAASFFNGVLGQFQAHSAFGTVGAWGGRGGGRDSAGRGPGDPGYQGRPPPRNVGSAGTARDTNPGTFDAGYSPNPGAQVTNSGVGSAIAQEDKIKQQGETRPRS